MIGYVTVGTNDLARGARFYDAIAKELGVGRMMETERFIAWGTPGGGAGIGLALPFDGKPATAGNGVMVALEAEKTKVPRARGVKASTPATFAISTATSSTRS